MRRVVFFALSWLLLLTLLIAGLVRPVTADADGQRNRGCFSAAWPHERSDLQPDPALTFGRLANGLRFVLLPNSKPEDRVALYLNVQAGSLQETDDQRGVAHFLEHMLFNGTSRYPPGTLIEYFQSIGMAFGADTNARTGYDATIYNLFLPSGKPAVVEEGIRVLADYARGALLLESEVERERGIILAEKLARDSTAARIGRQRLQFDFAGTLVAGREPIGTEEVLRSADSRLLRSYYDRWYRPENMIIVAVGTVRPEEIQSLIARYFGELVAPPFDGACPEFGKVQEEGIAALHLHEPDLGHTEITLSTVVNTSPRPATLSRETARLHEYAAIRMLANRLSQKDREAGSLISESRATAGVFLERIGYASLSTRTGAADWRHGLETVQAVLMQAVASGFGEQELARVKSELIAHLEKEEQTAETRDSRAVASSIIRGLNSDEVTLSPRQERAIYQPIVERLTLGEVNAAFRSLWQGKRRQLSVVGTANLGKEEHGAEAAIVQAFIANQSTRVAVWKEEVRPTFPYLPSPVAAGRIAERTRHETIGAETLALEGGVRLNLKPTDFQANQVLLSAQFGHGRQSEPADGMIALAEGVVAESGVGGLNREQLEASLAGTNVTLDFRVGAESFSFSGSGLTRELELLLQLLFARLHDPAFRPEAYHRSLERLRKAYSQLETSVEGVQQIQGERFLAGGSRHFGMAEFSQLERLRLEEISAWLRPAMKDAPLEINLVGDFSPQEAIELVRRYFGGESRTAQPDPAFDKAVFPAGARRQLTVASAIDKALLTVAWKSDDYWEIGRTRRFNVLASVLNDRLRVKIREELGATYSPSVTNFSSRVQPEFGILRSSLVVVPDQAPVLAGVIRAVAADLGKQSVGAEELRRALEPTLTAIQEHRRSNRYWLEAVLTLSSRHPEQFHWPLTISDDFAAITADDLRRLAAQHLQPELAAEVLVQPAPPKP